MPGPTLARLALLTFIALGAGACGSLGEHTAAGPDGPAQDVYRPSAERGPIVVLLSGHSGPRLYQGFAGELARLGYYAILLDGKDILTREQDGPGNLRKAIERAQRSPHAVAGKVVVIGFSQGGGGTLAHAANMPDLVAAAVAYYPQTNFTSDMRALAARFQVPLLVLAGAADRYHNCCLIESMRALEAAARERQAPFELVVYPYADHGFNLTGSNYRAGDDADAWRRTVEMLQRYQRLP
jgi:dienelactone hydrolase